ncbi:hypothetical protein WDU94_006149 [Cyamophila willieti]
MLLYKTLSCFNYCKNVTVTCLRIAQWSERRPGNPGGAGSKPTRGRVFFLNIEIFVIHDPTRSSSPGSDQRLKDLLSFLTIEPASVAQWSECRPDFPPPFYTITSIKCEVDVDQEDQHVDENLPLSESDHQTFDGQEADQKLEAFEPTPDGQEENEFERGQMNQDFERGEDCQTEVLAEDNERKSSPGGGGTSGKSRPSGNPLSPNGGNTGSVFHPWVRSPHFRFRRAGLGFRPILPAPEQSPQTTRAPPSRSRKKSRIPPLLSASYRCNVCDYVTRNKKLFNYHMNQQHASAGVLGQAVEQKPFSCNYCRYRCKSPSVLNVHVESVHYTDTLIDKIANK